MDLSHRLKRTYGSRMEIVQMDEGKTDDEPEFWKALGGRGDINVRVSAHCLTAPPHWWH